MVYYRVALGRLRFEQAETTRCRTTREKKKKSFTMVDVHVFVDALEGYKHPGSHCLELRVDGSSSVQRTPWTPDIFTRNVSSSSGSRHKQFRARFVFKNVRVVSPESCLHLALFHQRTLRMDKNVGEAHLRLGALQPEVLAWYRLQHKDKSGGKVQVAVRFGSVPSGVQSSDSSSQEFRFQEHHNNSRALRKKKKVYKRKVSVLRVIILTFLPSAARWTIRMSRLVSPG